MNSAPMAAQKTTKTGAAVDGFLGELADAQQRADAKRLIALMRRVTGAPPKMWGTAIVGFGEHQTVSAAGRVGAWFATGFSPRKGKLSLYIAPGLTHDPAEVKALGKVELAKACISAKRLADVDEAALETFIARALKRLPALTTPRTR